MWEQWKKRLRQAVQGPQFWLVIYSIALLVTSVGNSLYFKKVDTLTHGPLSSSAQVVVVWSAHPLLSVLCGVEQMLNKMENYVYFLNQFTTIMSASLSHLLHSPADCFLDLSLTCCRLRCVFRAASRRSSSRPCGISSTSRTASPKKCQPHLPALPSRWAVLCDLGPLLTAFFLLICRSLRTSFPKVKFFWMGVFDSISGVLTSVAHPPPHPRLSLSAAVPHPPSAIPLPLSQSVRCRPTRVVRNQACC